MAPEEVEIPKEEGSSSPSPPPALELNRICKSFGLVQANKNVSLRIEKGEIYGIVGENGAGKSTLMNIIYGLQRPNSGDISIKGRKTTIHNSADAIRCGIGMVHQHFMLVPNFSVLENVMLGTEGGALLKNGYHQTREVMERLARDYGMTVDPEAIVEELPVGLQQRVEIIKSLKGGAKILILDEPTGVLTPQEAESLFDILRVLKRDGVTILLITHKLAEIMAVTDNVAIMRHGEVVGTRKTAETNPEELAELMVGRKVILRVEKGDSKLGETRLKVSGLSCHSKSGAALLQDMSFEVRAGEVLGVAGVSGNGQSELLEVLGGMRRPDSGSVQVMGQEVSAESKNDARQMRDLGLCHIPEDRHKHGLVLTFEAHENAILGYYHTELAGAGHFLDKGAMTRHCQALMDKNDVRPPNPHLVVRKFSGGNQQKLVIAREMNAEPKILIIGQPTRGVDIGAIEAIHGELLRRRQEGCAILLVSVELEEILALSDRIMVMNAGQQVGIVPRAEADEQVIGLMMAGISRDNLAAAESAAP